MNEGAVVRIVVADDHPIFREGLKGVLNADPTFCVVGEAGDSTEAVRLVSALRPEVLLVDLSLPHAGGLHVLEQITHAAPSVRTLVLTAGHERTDMLTAVQRGARGVLVKNAGPALVLESIRRVMQDHYWLDGNDVGQVIEAMRRLTAQLEDEARKKEVDRFGLTRRELQIVRGVAMSESNKGIAQQLSVREDTIKHHLMNIFDKLGVFSRVELAVFAINHNLVATEEIESSPAVRRRNHHFR